LKRFVCFQTASNTSGHLGLRILSLATPVGISA
jgi:hypothetical protein